MLAWATHEFSQSPNKKTFLGLLALSVLMFLRLFRSRHRRFHTDSNIQSQPHTYYTSWVLYNPLLCRQKANHLEMLTSQLWLSVTHMHHIQEPHLLLRFVWEINMNFAPLLTPCPVIIFSVSKLISCIQPNVLEISMSLMVSGNFHVCGAVICLINTFWRNDFESGWAAYLIDWIQLQSDW